MRCPMCGKTFNVQDAMMDQEWREIIQLLPSFGGHGRLIFEYIEKFGVSPLRMKSKKILRLLEEMARLFKTGEFMYQKRKHTAGLPVVIEAIKAVCNKHFAIPIENHNYLKKVMIGLQEEAEREKSKRKEKELREREIVLKSEIRHPKSETGEMTAQEYLASVGKESLREK